MQMPTISATSHLFPYRTGKSGIVNLGVGRRYARVVVGDAEALELALLVELVDGAQGLFVRRGAVRAVEVPHVDGAVSWKQGKRLRFNASGMTLR